MPERKQARPAGSRIIGAKPVCRAYAAKMGLLARLRPSVHWRVRIAWLCVGVAAFATSIPVAAQLDQLELRVEPEDVGIGGHVRPGQWTPMRVAIENPTADDVEVTLTWPVRDADGDIAKARRTAVINAQRTEQMWLYAPLPLSSRPDAIWTLRATTGDGLDQGTPPVAVAEPLSVRVEPARWTPPGKGLIAVMSDRTLGLGDYTRQSTQHEALTLIQDLSLADLPDRAHGLAMLDAIVWTGDTGGDPADPAVSPAVLSALRQYVSNGGHLIVVLPRIGQTWTQSPLADLLPVPPEAVRRVTAEPPRLGAVQLPGVEAVSMHVFDVANEASNAAVLLRDKQDRPVIVAARRGLGSVTLVGLDLTDPVFRGELTSGDRRIWNTIFGWSAPVYSANREARETGESGGGDPAMRPTREFDARPLLDFVGSRVAMRGTVATLSLVAVLLLLLYVAAAAASFFVARKRGTPHLAWSLFAVVVAGFSALAWGGAWVARPNVLRAQHVSVLDIAVPKGGVTNQASVRSWVSLFLPGFGAAEVALPEQDAGTIAALGVAVEGFNAGFLDAQTYAVEAAEPKSLDLPVRATTRRLSVATTTSNTRAIDADRTSTGDAAQLGPAAFIADEPPTHDLLAGTLNARLRHALPGPLRDVTVVYAPGETFRAGRREVQTPWVWRPNVDAGTGERSPWGPGEVLAIDGRPPDAVPLVTVPPRYDEDREIKDEGFLGVLLDQQGGTTEQLLANDAAVTRRLTLLSFFDAVPPAKFTKLDWPPPITLQRRLGRELDLTDLLSAPRLIVIGHLLDSPLPVELTVDGDVPPADGWTTVRLIYDL